MSRLQPTQIEVDELRVRGYSMQEAKRIVQGKLMHMAVENADNTEELKDLLHVIVNKVWHI
jgi:hypothetical protein